ncbi:hypothetical protein [Muricoccus aerilatus]|uniref:hypothetical protein n=1 Tax=Muricoccus aerilatus TaxID=452982 RepID=UPI0005C1A5F6|nr:hypothetical protein [Roseomonas aerilata]
MISYTVRQDGGAWKIVQGVLSYTGYKSEASASKAAIAVASKLGLNGEATSVMIEGPDGSSRSIFQSDPEPPTIDSMMLSASNEVVRIRMDKP